MEQKILQQYISEGKTIKEIAEALNMPIGTTRYWLRKFKLKTFGRCKHKISDQQLLEAAAKSSYMNECLRNLGLKTSGGSFFHYKKRLNQLGVFFKDGKENSRSLGGQATANKLFAKSVEQKKRLRRPALKAALDRAGREYRCQCCGLSHWMGNLILLHIHHKDEDPTNNTIDNLEYLCPNCHGTFHHPNLAETD
jgi:hypothetical protein